MSDISLIRQCIAFDSGERFVLIRSSTNQTSEKKLTLRLLGKVMRNEEWLSIYQNFEFHVLDFIMEMTNESQGRPAL